MDFIVPLDKLFFQNLRYRIVKSTIILHFTIACKIIRWDVIYFMHCSSSQSWPSTLNSLVQQDQSWVTNLGTIILVNMLKWIYTASKFLYNVLQTQCESDEINLNLVIKACKLQWERALWRCQQSDLHTAYRDQAKDTEL